MAWKKTPESLRQAFQSALPNDPAVDRGAPSNDPTAYVGGHIFAAIREEEMVLRLAEADREALLAFAGSAAWEKRPGEFDREYVVVPTSMLGAMDELRAWTLKAFQYVQTLPPKAPEPAEPEPEPKQPLVDLEPVRKPMVMKSISGGVTPFRRTTPTAAERSSAPRPRAPRPKATRAESQPTPTRKKNAKKKSTAKKKAATKKKTAAKKKSAAKKKATKKKTAAKKKSSAARKSGSKKTLAKKKAATKKKAAKKKATKKKTAAKKKTNKRR